jgi:hypothetical protein
MTFIDVLTALVIIGLFFFGLSQVFLPTRNAWESAMNEYTTAHSIYFIAESFLRECENPDRDLESWKRAISVVKELETYDITELLKEDILWALMLTFTISGEHLEVIGVCMP